MKKIIFILFLSIFSLSVYSNNSYQNQSNDLDMEKVSADIDTMRMHKDSTVHYAKGIFKILKEEVKMVGLKKTIQLNANIFLPIVIILVFILVRLKNSNKE